MIVIVERERGLQQTTVEGPKVKTAKSEDAKNSMKETGTQHKEEQHPESEIQSTAETEKKVRTQHQDEQHLKSKIQSTAKTEKKVGTLEQVTVFAAME